MLTLFFAAGLVVALALLVVINGRLADLPLAVWSLAKKERVEEAPKALDAMKEAVALKAGSAVISIRRYEEDLAAGYRAQVADAEVRARVTERRAADTVTALQAATTLVREVRALRDAATPAAAPMLSPSMSPTAAEHEEEAERETKEIISGLVSVAVDEDGLGDDETTRVGRRPCIPPPSVGKRGAS
jgi:hypothetical protein